MSKFIDEVKQLEVTRLQEELAKTYFSASPSHEENSTHSQPVLKNKKMRKPSIGVITSLLIAIMAVVFIINRVEVNVNLIPGWKTTSSLSGNPPGIIHLSKNGELNTDLIKNIVFYENCDKDSIWGKEFITLSNEAPAKKAVLGIDFNRPLNLRETSLYFYSKGQMGGEDFLISLRDSNGNLCNSKINELQNTWQEFVVTTEKASDLIDVEKVTHIDLEVNPAEKENLSPSTVYFKTIYLAKNKKEE